MSYPDEEWLRERYHGDGMTTVQIAELVDRSTETVRGHLERKGIDRRSRGRNANTDRDLYTLSEGYEVVTSGEDRAYLHHLVLISKGEDPHDVFSDQYHAHHKNHIQFDNRPSNLELLTDTEHHRLHMKENHEKTVESKKGPWWDEDRLREMYHDEQMTTHEIADVFGTAQKTISDTMHSLGIETRSRGRSRPQPWHDPDILHKYYVEEDMTQKEIADHFEVSRVTISNWLQRTGVTKAGSP